VSGCSCLKITPACYNTHNTHRGPVRGGYVLLVHLADQHRRRLVSAYVVNRASARVLLRGRVTRKGWPGPFGLGG